MLRAPRPMKDKSRQNPNKYCYHNQRGHYTSGCRDLLKQLWKLYEDGRLNEFVKNPRADNQGGQGRQHDRQPGPGDRVQRELVIGAAQGELPVPPIPEGTGGRVIHTISPLATIGGLSPASSSKRRLKAEVRAMENAQRMVLPILVVTEETRKIEFYEGEVRMDI